MKTNTGCLTDRSKTSARVAWESATCVLAGWGMAMIVLFLICIATNGIGSAAGESRDLLGLFFLIGLTVGLVWLFAFMPLYIFTAPTNIFWRWPGSVIVGALFGAGMLLLIWPMVAGEAGMLVLAIVVSVTSFVLGGWLKRRGTRTALPEDM